MCHFDLPVSVSLGNRTADRSGRSTGALAMTHATRSGPSTIAIHDEQALVARLRGGDADAYEHLVRTLGGRLLAVARRFLRDEDAAADAVQEAFVSAFRAMGGFDGQAQLATWLHRIVVNTCLMRLRRQRRRPEQSIEGLLPCFVEDGHHAEPVVSWADSAERQLERRQIQQLVREGLDELPDAARTLIVMRDIEGISTRDAAEVLGISDNALKLRLHRARQALAEIMRRKLSRSPQGRRATGATRGRLSEDRPARSMDWSSAPPSHRVAP